MSYCPDCGYDHPPDPWERYVAELVAELARAVQWRWVAGENRRYQQQRHRLGQAAT